MTYQGWYYDNAVDCSVCVRESRLWLWSCSQLPPRLPASVTVRSRFDPTCTPRGRPGVRGLFTGPVDHLQLAAWRHRTRCHHRSVTACVHWLGLVVFCGCFVSYRVTTHLENMGKWWNLRVVRQNSKSRGKVRGNVFLHVVSYCEFVLDTKYVRKEFFTR